MAWISGFEVEANEIIPTPKVLKLKVTGDAAAEERTYAKKLKSMKETLLNKIGELTKGKTNKEQREISKENVEQLKQSIAKECQGEKTRPEILAKAKDTNGYWRLWSKTVERGWLRFLDKEKIYDPRSTGRGKVQLIQKKTAKKKGRWETKDLHRRTGSQRAHRRD